MSSQGVETEVHRVGIEELDASEELSRNDSLGVWWQRLRVWLGWATLLIPFRLYHIYFWCVFYVLWYRGFIAPLRRMGGQFCINLAFLLEWLAVKCYVPFFSWWFLLQFGIYGIDYEMVDEDHFDEICRKYQGDAEHDDILKKRASTDPYLRITNHISPIDTVAMFQIWGEVGTIAKASVRHDKIFADLMTIMGGLYTDQLQLAEEIIRRCEEFSHPDRPLFSRPLVIFPEGTTTNGRWMLNFHKGAFVAGQPIRIWMNHYEFTHFDPAFTCPDEMTLEYVQLIHCQLYLKLKVLLLPTYVPTEAEAKDPILFGNNVRKVMRDVFNQVMFERAELNLSKKLFVRHWHQDCEDEEEGVVRDGERERVQSV